MTAPNIVTSGSLVPIELRLLLNDMIEAVLNDAVSSTPLNAPQICRLIADFLDTELDLRTQHELATPTTNRQQDSGQPVKKSTENRNAE